MCRGMNESKIENINKYEYQLIGARHRELFWSARWYRIDSFDIHAFVYIMSFQRCVIGLLE